MQSNRIEQTVVFDGFNGAQLSSVTPSDRSSFLVQDMYRLIEAQQATIAKLNSEVAKRSQNVSRDIYEECLNECEKEKYEHAKTKLSLMEANDRLRNLNDEVEHYKHELERERKAYENVFSLLKDKALNESTKSMDLMEKIVQSEVRYNDVLQSIVEKEKLYDDLYSKLKKKEKKFENKLSEINLKSEQDKYINRLIDDSKVKTKLKK